MEKPKVYIAGKLNDKAVNYLYNVHKMCTLAEKARKAGFSVFVPALDLFMGIMFGYNSYYDYFDNSQPWLKAADAVLLVDNWQDSKGTKAEIKMAMDHGIPVFMSLDNMRKYFFGVYSMSPKLINEKVKEELS